MMRQHHHHGFTLMEVLVALFILSIMSITAVSGLNAVLRSQSHQVGLAHQLEDLQMTYTWLEQDLGEFVARAVHNAGGEKLPALMLHSDLQLSQLGIQGLPLLALTRGGIIDPNNLTSLQRVAYAFKDKQLIRYTWAVLDAVPATLIRPQVLLHNVANIQIRYLSDQGAYYSNWRDYTGKAKFPLAAEWQITDDKGRSVTWFFPITGGGSDGEEEQTTTQQQK